jgi:hypothetical protein
MFGLIRSDDIAPVDTDETIMMAVQFPVEWLNLTDEELAVQVVEHNGLKFLKGIYEAIKHHRENPEPKSGLVVPGRELRQVNVGERER